MTQQHNSSSGGQILPALYRLKALEQRIAAGALILMMVVTIVDVFLRFAFNSPIRGSYDLVECTLVVFVFHGMAAAFLDRRNIAIDVLDYFVSERTLSILIRISDVLSILCLLLVTWAMTTPAWQAFNYGDRKIDLGVPVFALWIIAFAGMAATILCAIGAMLTPPTAEEDSAA